MIEPDRLRKIMMQGREFKNTIIELKRLLEETREDSEYSYPCPPERIVWLQKFMMGTEKFTQKQVRDNMQEIIEDLEGKEKIKKWSLL